MTASFIDLFSGHADDYAAARPSYPPALFEYIATQAPARRLAWDCGTGNGQAAASLARHFNAVVATDPSEEQIRNAVRVENVRYAVEPAESTTLPDRSVDAICTAQALHWFALGPFFAEVQRVASPGAVFAAWGYTWFSVSPAFDSAFRTFVGDMIAPYWAPQNKLLWDGYVDVAMPFPKITAPPFSIEARWTLGQLLAYVRTWSAARKCLAVNGQAAFDAAESRLAAAWGAPGQALTVTMPLHLLMGRV